MRGNHHYCFVDFETREEAIAAIKALDGRPIVGGKLKVALAATIPKTIVNRHTDARYGRRVHDGGDDFPPNSSRSENMAESSRATASSDWRRRDDE